MKERGEALIVVVTGWVYVLGECALCTWISPPHLSVSGRKGKRGLSEKVFEAETAMESGLFWCGIEHIAETHSSDCC